MWELLNPGPAWCVPGVETPRHGTTLARVSTVHAPLACHQLVATRIASAPAKKSPGIKTLARDIPTYHVSSVSCFAKLYVGALVADSKILNSNHL